MELNKLLYLAAFVLFVIGMVSFIAGFNASRELFIIAYIFLPAYFIVWIAGNIITIRKKQGLGILGWVDTIIALIAPILFYLMMVWSFLFPIYAY